MGVTMKASFLGASHIVLSVAVVLTMGTLQAAEPSDIELVRSGKRQELSEQTRSAIADLLPKLLATCSLNSRDHPQIFASRGLATIWEDTEAKDHLRIQLPEPIEVRAGESRVISIQEFLVRLDDPRFPGPELSRHGERVVAHTKCSGYDVIGFVCAPGVKAVMPSSYHGLCRYLAHAEHGDAQPVDAPDRLPAGSRPPANGR